MTTHELCGALGERPVIAAVRDESALAAALDSRCVAVFFLGGSLLSLPGWVEAAKRAGKAAFAHVDLLQGVKADAAAIEWCKQAMPLDGVISTRAPLLKIAPARQTWWKCCPGWWARPSARSKSNWAVR